MSLVKCVWGYFKRRLRIVWGCPWSLSGCQGNFFLWVIPGARESRLAIAWLRPCARTADVQVLMTHHSKRRPCQLYLVLWCMDVLFISAQLSLMLRRFLFSGLSYSAQTSYLQFPNGMIQWMLAIWSLVPLPFLKTAWTSGSSRDPNTQSSLETNTR